MLSKLGWVLLGGNNTKTEISLNHITSDRNLENSVDSEILNVMGL